MKILLAEDDPVSRRLVESRLVKWGYDVEVVSNGAEAWEVLQRQDAPRLAILDWMMPGMDGAQVCREVRKRTRQQYVYIILLTAKDDKQDLIQGMAAGADDYITKPFDAHELEARLRVGTRILELQTELLALSKALQEQATHDPLTGLPNRLLFSDRLTQRLALARRQQQLLAIMFIDLDRFKRINDALGHSTGDELLKQAARRLTESLREADAVARMGGDEFTAILTGIAGAEDAGRVAQRALDVLSEPFVLNGHELFVTASAGIAFYPQDGADVETLVKNADSAMYRAKEQGGNNYQFYTEALNAAVLERVTLANDLRKALERQEFQVYYQPLVDIRTCDTLGAEALVRWRHPQLGMLFPDQFISLAEETGLIVPMDEQVLHAACAQNKAWQDAGFPPIEMAVNTSGQQLRQGDLVEAVKRVLAETDLDPQYLTLELTESALMSDPDLAAGVLRRLKAIGVRIAIDDFGAAHFSLDCLKRFPIDIVKIDRSFVRGITTNPNDAAIAGTVVALAHSLKLKVIAEGVETLAQLGFLRSLDCDEMQGYFVSRPVPSEEFTELLREAHRAGTGDFSRAA